MIPSPRFQPGQRVRVNGNRLWDGTIERFNVMGTPCVRLDGGTFSFQCYMDGTCPIFAECLTPIQPAEPQTTLEEIEAMLEEADALLGIRHCGFNYNMCNPQNLTIAFACNECAATIVARAAELLAEHGEDA